MASTSDIFWLFSQEGFTREDCTIVTSEVHNRRAYANVLPTQIDVAHLVQNDLKAEVGCIFDLQPLFGTHFWYAPVVKGKGPHVNLDHVSFSAILNIGIIPIFFIHTYIHIYIHTRSGNSRAYWIRRRPA